MEKFPVNPITGALFTNLNASLIPPGAARISQNMLLDIPLRVKLRSGILRKNNASGGVPAYGLFQYITSTGTATAFVQYGGGLYPISLSTGTISGGILVANQSTAIPRFTEFLNFGIEADHQDNNYIFNASAGYPFQIAAPSVAFTAVASTGTGLTAGTYQYDYARYSTVTGEISPARGSAVSVAVSGGNLQSTVTTSSTISTTQQFDQVQLYRTRVGGSQYYELAKISVASFNSGYVDSTPDASLLNQSTIHDRDNNGVGTTASSTSRPEAALDCVQHKGRLHFIGLLGATSRHRWSQLLAYQFDSTTDARHDVEPDDGDVLVRGISLDGALVLFKRNSIHLMNGDVDQSGFTWQIASPKAAGIGGYCPNTVVSTGTEIYFIAACGAYSYVPGGMPERISDAIQDQLEALDYTYRDKFTAAWDPCLKAIIFSVTPSGQTTNTISYVYYTRTKAWGTFAYAGGKIKPSTSMLAIDSSNDQELYIGDSLGYVYKCNTGTVDGPISGTTSGTPTAGTSTTLTDSGASFYNSGDKLTGISITTKSGSTYETQLISSNTGTVITSSSWSVTPTTAMTYYVGALDGQLELGRINCGVTDVKRFKRITFNYQSQSGSAIPVLFGYTLDDDSAPTLVESTSQNGRRKATIMINRRGLGLSPYIRVVGAGAVFELISIDIEYEIFSNRCLEV